MLAKTQRLDRAGFDRVFTGGKRVHSTLFQVIFLPAPILTAAAVVPKKAVKGAVSRNHLRRRIYHILRELGVTGQYVVIAKRGIEGTSYETLKEELERTVGRLSRSG